MMVSVGEKDVQQVSVSGRKIHNLIKVAVVYCLEFGFINYRMVPFIFRL